MARNIGKTTFNKKIKYSKYYRIIIVCIWLIDSLCWPHNFYRWCFIHCTLVHIREVLVTTVAAGSCYCLWRNIAHCRTWFQIYVNVNGCLFADLLAVCLYAPIYSLLWEVSAVNSNCLHFHNLCSIFAGKLIVDKKKSLNKIAHG